MAYRRLRHGGRSSLVSAGPDRTKNRAARDQVCARAGFARARTRPDPRGPSRPGQEHAAWRGRAEGRRPRVHGRIRARPRERAGGSGSALWAAVIRCAPAMSDRREAGELIGTFLSLAPAALVIDDGHLVDELSLRMFDELAVRIGSRPVLLAIAAGTHLMDGRGLDILNGSGRSTTQRRSGSGRSTTTERPSSSAPRFRTPRRSSASNATS